MKQIIATTFLAGLLVAVNAYAQLETRTSVSGGVTVKITPKDLAVDASVWEFSVVLDTHSQDLSDDLTRVAALIGPDGNRYSPLAWDGAAPGGHHREGVIRFQPIKPTPRVVELQLQRPGESATRVFRWDLVSP